MMDCWSSTPERVDKYFDIADIAGQNRFRKFDSYSHEMGIYDI